MMLSDKITLGHELAAYIELSPANAPIGDVPLRLHFESAGRIVHVCDWHDVMPLPGEGMPPDDGYILDDGSQLTGAMIRSISAQAADLLMQRVAAAPSVNASVAA